MVALAVALPGDTRRGASRRSPRRSVRPRRGTRGGPLLVIAPPPSIPAFHWPSSRRRSRSQDEVGLSGRSPHSILGEQGTALERPAVQADYGLGRVVFAVVDEDVAGGHSEGALNGASRVGASARESALSCQASRDGLGHGLPGLSPRGGVEAVARLRVRHFLVMRTIATTRNVITPAWEGQPHASVRCLG